MTDYLRRWLAHWNRSEPKPATTPWDWRVPATHPQNALRERKLIRIIGGPGSGLTVVIEERIGTVLVPHVDVDSCGYVEGPVAYQFSGKVAPDYVELWTPMTAAKAEEAK